MGDVSEIIGGGTPSTNHPEYWDGDIDWYSPAEILDQIYVKRSRRRITQLGYDNSSAKLLPPGTVLFTSRAGIGKTAILSQKSCTNQGFQSIVPHENQLDTYFIFSRTNELKRYGELVGAGSTFAEVSGKQMSAMNLMLPTTIQEQQLIGQFFKKLDCLITLHQQKITRLIKLKKAMLEKMFPKKGSVIPEIRFNGFANAWEQRKFEDMAVRSSEISSETILPRVEYEDIISGTGCLNKNIFDKESCKNGIIFHKGDVLYGKLRPYLQNWLLPSFNGIAVGDFWVLKPQNVDSSFLYILIQSRKFDEIANQSTGTKMPRADWNLVSKSKFFIPCTVDEQATIGTYFKRLDNLITLHQRKIDMLKKLKSACLSEMFI
ncbi:MAG: restriction endonuclease subunit S [Ligilactobacillus ruminis]